MALITKQEMGIACYILLAFVLMEARFQRSAQTLLRGITACTPGVVLAAAVYGWFFWKVTPGVILYANWQFSPGGYYMRSYGPQMNAAIGLRFIPAEWLFLISNGAGALLAWFLIAKVTQHLKRSQFIAAVAILAAILGLLHYHSGPLGRASNVAWYVLLFPRGLFFIGLGALIYELNELRRRPEERLLRAEGALALFAVVSGIRVLAETAPFDYGIFYTVPLLLVFLIAVSRCIAIAARDLLHDQRHALVSALLAAEVILLAVVIAPIESGRNTRFQTTWGSIYLTAADARTARRIYDFILEQKQHGRRVLLIPELPMMYAFTGTEAPSRWYSTVVTYLSPEQEEGYVAELNRDKPDFVIECTWLADRHGTAFGEDFGKDYDRKTYSWIETNYNKAGEFGDFERGNGRFLAALLYQLRGASPAVSH